MGFEHSTKSFLKSTWQQYSRGKKKKTHARKFLLPRTKVTKTQCHSENIATARVHPALGLNSCCIFTLLGTQHHPTMPTQKAAMPLPHLDPAVQPWHWHNSSPHSTIHPKEQAVPHSREAALKTEGTNVCVSQGLRTSCLAPATASNSTLLTSGAAEHMPQQMEASLSVPTTASNSDLLTGGGAICRVHLREWGPRTSWFDTYRHLCCPSNWQTHHTWHGTLFHSQDWRTGWPGNFCPQKSHTVASTNAHSLGHSCTFKHHWC